MEVAEGVACYIADAQYSVPRLKTHFGKDLCWPVAVTNKRGKFALTVCPCKGQPGHEPDGALHQVDAAKKADMQKRVSAFKLKPGEPGFRKDLASQTSGNKQGNE